jgi:hypothetical protein
MNLQVVTENEFEKVVRRNSLYTIYETKALITLKNKKRFEFTFDEIYNIKIIKVERNIFPIQFLLVLATISGLFFSFIETNGLRQVVYLVISYLIFLSIFYVKKITYQLCIDKKNSNRYRLSIKTEMLGDMQTFVQTIKEIERQRKEEISSADQTTL